MTFGRQVDLFSVDVSFLSSEILWGGLIQARWAAWAVAGIVPRGIVCELSDVHVVWLIDNRITFTGDERVVNAGGKSECYKQSWLCTLDTDVQILRCTVNSGHVRFKPPAPLC